MLFKKISIGIFFVILVFFSAGTVINMIFPSQEGQREHLQKTAAADERYLESFERSLSGHFALQDRLMALGSTIKIISGMQVVNNVYVVGDHLIKNVPLEDNTTAKRNISSINQFTEGWGKDGPAFYAMIIPNAAGIYADSIPAYAKKTSEKEIIDKIYQQLHPSIKMLDAYTPLSAASSESIFYKSDTHWTSLGAFRTYYSVSNSLGIIPFEEMQFNVEHFHSFRGNLYSKVLYPYAENDIINLFTSYEGKITEVRAYDQPGKNSYTLYNDIFFRSYLDYADKEKYHVFLGKPSPMLTITTDNDSKSSIAIFKDSFSNTLVQFLVKNYSKITLIDLSMMREDFDYYTELQEYTQILYAYNLETFWHNQSIQKLSQ